MPHPFYSADPFQYACHIRTATSAACHIRTVPHTESDRRYRTERVWFTRLLYFTVYCWTEVNNLIHWLANCSCACGCRFEVLFCCCFRAIWYHLSVYRVVAPARKILKEVRQIKIHRRHWTLNVLLTYLNNLHATGPTREYSLASLGIIYT